MLTNFGWPMTLLGAGVLAPLLYALQRLRTRRRVVALPGAMLWRQAMQAAPARVLGGRFRYWLAYLLVLAIALLLWLAAAHPALAPVSGGVQRFYLDSSAVLTGRGDLARAKRALLADVRATPAERREVFAADGRLLAVGESASLLARRLDSVEAAAQPSAFAAWLARHSAGASIRYYGGAAALRGVPGTVRSSYLADPVPDNRGIVALGVSPAASGTWRDADVIAAVAAGAKGALPTAADLRWTLDGKDFAPTVSALGDGRYLGRDVPATGGVLSVALRRGDGFPADDRATLRLPDRRPLRVALLAGTPAAVRGIVQANDSFAIVPAAQAQVVVGDATAVRPLAKPALVIAADSTQSAFVFAGPREAARGDLVDRLDDLGLAQLDAGALATALHRPIGVDVRDASRRSVAVWSALFAPATPFAQGAAMPVFVAQSLHWLGGGEGWRPYAKAGAPQPDQSALYGLTAARDPADDPTALTDRATTRGVAAAATRPVTAIAGVLPPDLPFMLLLVGAGLLLALEWWLVQRGRMP